jgi:hypothetical protein
MGCATEFAQHWCKKTFSGKMLAAAAVADRVHAEIGKSLVAVGFPASDALYRRLTLGVSHLVLAVG